MKISTIWKAGLTEDMDAEDRKIVTFSNGIYIIIASLLLFFEVITGGIISIFREFSLQAFIPFSLIFLSVLCLALNSFRFYLMSRSLYLTALIYLMSIL